MGIDPDDARLRPFAHHVFHFAAFDERRFGDDHYHCIGCWRTIAEPHHKDTEREGYVTVHTVQYTGFPIAFQYAWACARCFLLYRDIYDWQVSPAEPPEIPEEANREFNAAYKEYLAEKKR